MLRWNDANDGGNDHGLALDDVTVTFFAPTAAPVTIAGKAVDTRGLPIRGAVITLTGGNLEAPIVVLTNTFGYFRFTGIPSGQSYVIEAASKRYFFGNSPQVINVEDDLANVDFLGLPN